MPTPSHPLIDSSSENAGVEMPSPPKRKRRNRWGGGKVEVAAADRYSSGTAPPPVVASSLKIGKDPSETAVDPGAVALARIRALQSSIAPRLAALKATDPPPSAPKRARVFDIDEVAVDVTAVASVMSNTAAARKKREQEHMALSQQRRGKRRKENEEEKVQAILSEKANPYLSHVVAEGEEGEKAVVEEVLLDSRLQGGGRRRGRKELKFFNPGTFILKAERKRAKATLAAKSGFSSGRKDGTYVKGRGVADISFLAKDDLITSESGANLENMEQRHEQYLPPRSDMCNAAPYAMEWWDCELLPSKLRREVAKREQEALVAITKASVSILLPEDKASTPSDENKSIETLTEEAREINDRCASSSNFLNAKTATLVQHPVPVRPPGASIQPPPAPTLHLTKREMKRQRKLRRAEAQRELQDQQALGLIPAPEPRLTLSNFMKVLGDQAVLDPSKMEAVALGQMRNRKLRHEKMNAERALTPEERRAKKSRKLLEDTSKGLSVAIFYVMDMSHPYHRAKVDLNAQQNNLTGGVIECAVPPITMVIVEGGPKAVRRYVRLMTVRMKWKGEGFEEEKVRDNPGLGEGDGEEGDEPHKFNPDNKCELVWTGMGPKKKFNSFDFQSCATSEMCRKVLEMKGVAHFWDQLVTHASGIDDTFNFKLGGNSAASDAFGGPEDQQRVHMEED
eukprot:CAMPEP_0113329920 /NCGR_PEP_ID=MMETSP0010_2-20120614/21247_1 /TAXON_ID=216773 ORGANISM="Corethron hystrix, Strain 308" /NCGR_SAMPLE_ID=MMETSP0010_2 /ASSEMBLY_ACC=CAM_ASM_000155 /LENGTH=682 /DNA_ID=CAMNT_0000192221 /DNA_START=625 /DNA_END=2673 /DNA_ORIENTATION=+ /assembly_acc=CAM_ASM_000155